MPIQFDPSLLIGLTAEMYSDHIDSSIQGKFTIIQVHSALDINADPHAIFILEPTETGQVPMAVAMVLRVRQRATQAPRGAEPES
jgi:hypothetical protein